MTNNREVCLYMAQILDQTDRHQDMVDLMKSVVELNPELSQDERNLLSVAYKNIVGSRRNGLRILAAIIDHDEGKASENRARQLQVFKDTIITELEQYCYELINLVDSKLLPAANTPEARVFYEKLKADYYRYICEARTEDKKEEPANKAKECYENALKIAKEEIAPYRPTLLGLILNYSVFLYEIMGQKQEAVELAQKTYDDTNPFLSQNSDNSYNEASMILTLLRDNVQLWTQQAQPEAKQE